MSYNISRSDILELAAKKLRVSVDRVKIDFKTKQFKTTAESHITFLPRVENTCYFVVQFRPFPQDNGDQTNPYMRLRISFYDADEKEVILLKHMEQVNDTLVSGIKAYSLYSYIVEVLYFEVSVL